MPYLLAAEDAATGLLLTICALLGVGLAAQWGAWRLRIPSILLLLGLGFLAGPDRLGLVDPDAIFGDHLLPLVSLSVGIILFEGGLSLRFSELGETGAVVWRLVSIGALVTWVLGALAAALFLGLDAGMCTLLGAVLIVSGPTVVGPMLHHIKPRGATSPILKWEGIVIDPIGAVAALLVFETLDLESMRMAAPLALGGIFDTLLAGAVCGFAGAGFILLVLRRYWIPDNLHVPLALTVVVVAFTGANAYRHESGLLAVTILGVVLANQKQVSMAHILEFKENLRVLLISSLFILLAAQLDNSALSQINAGAFAFLAALILIVRPLAVWICTARSALTRNERIFLAWVCPRGIVAAAVASVFALRLGPRAEALVPLTFLVIVGTVVIYGLTAPWLARRLGLSIPNPQGVLFVGAHVWAREIAEALHAQDIPVLLVDTNRQNIRQARLRGLPATTGDATHEHTQEDLDLGGLGRVLALTSNDGVNRLVMLHFTHEFGRREVYRISSGKTKEVEPGQRRGRVVFGEGTAFPELAAKFRQGHVIRATPLTEQFDYEAFRAEHGDETVLLFTIDQDGKLSINNEDKALEPKVGETLLALVPQPAEAPADTPI